MNAPKSIMELFQKQGKFDDKDHEQIAKWLYWEAFVAPQIKKTIQDIAVDGMFEDIDHLVCRDWAGSK